MILVLLGTQDKPFTRLLDAIEKELQNGNIKDKVVVQAGHTPYESDKMEIFDLLLKEEYDKMIKDASIIITHGGVSAIFDGIKNSIPVIAVARLSKYNEHTNDHQLQIIKKFNDEGYIIGLDDINNLNKVLNKVKKFKANKFKSNTNNVIKTIEEYIDND